MRSAPMVGIAFALAVVTGCRKKEKPPEAVPDAGVISQIADPELGFRILLEKGWFPKMLDKAAKEGHERAEALRAPTKGHAYFVAPRIVVLAEPSSARDTDELVKKTVDDLRSLDEKPGVRVKRRATSTRYVDGVKVGDIEIAYEVKDPKQDSGREVVQRSLVMLRTKADATASAVTITVSYMAEDAEAVGAEVHRMLSSLSFARDDAQGPRIVPRGEVALSQPDAGTKQIAPTPPSSQAVPDDEEDDNPVAPKKKKKKHHKKRRTRE